MASKEELEKIYADALKGQTDQIHQQQEYADAQFDEQKAQNQQTTQKNLNRTAVEGAQAMRNQAEYHAASGLGSGAAAQARISQSNQVQSDMTAIRAAGQTADEAIERMRAEKAKYYSDAIINAQKANDLALAKALYEQARQEEAKLEAQKQQNAQLMASIGKYGLYGELNGLTQEQIDQLEAAYAERNSGYSGGGGWNSNNNPDDDWEPYEFNGTPVDTSSLEAAGYDPEKTSEAELVDLVRRGYLEWNVVNGRIVFSVPKRPDPVPQRGPHPENRPRYEFN